MTELMGDEFDIFVNACFECNVLDENSISKSTLEYLHWCGIIRYPESSEIDQNEIKSWWDRNKSGQYLDILDILTTITPVQEEGPEVVPLVNKKWANLKSSNILFEILPNRGGEKNYEMHSSNNTPYSIRPKKSPMD